MTPPRSHTLLTAVCAVAALVATMVPDSPPARPGALATRAAPSIAPAPPARGPAAVLPDPREASRRPTSGRAGGGTARRQRRQARATAHAFLVAFLAYERGARGRAVSHALARSARPALARALCAAPPRLKALAVLERRGRGEVLELQMRRRHGRWRVSRLG